MEPKMEEGKEDGKSCCAKASCCGKAFKAGALLLVGALGGFFASRHCCKAPLAAPSAVVAPQ